MDEAEPGSDPRVFLENARDDISSVVHNDVDVSVDRDGLSSNRMKFGQRSRDVEFKSRSALLLELIEFGEGTSASS